MQQLHLFFLCDDHQRFTMGYGWRRVTEAVRQKVTTDKQFLPTSNARNEAMFKEASDFCVHLKTLERDLRSLHKEVEGESSQLLP